MKKDNANRLYISVKVKNQNLTKRVKSNQKHIRIGFIEKFKGEDSILISVDIHGLLELEKIFLELSENLTDFNFDNLKLLDNKYRINLKAFSDNENIGLLKTTHQNYEWRVTKEKWREFREKLTTMYRLGNYGHHYLDSDSKENIDLQIIMSWNEYGIDFWNKLRN